MATLSKHGDEVGRIEYTTYAKAFMMDRTILINRGRGWKTWGKMKPHVDPEEFYRKKLDQFEASCMQYPLNYKYHCLLHKLTSRQDRAAVHETLKVLGNDPDGCWCELQDYWGIYMDLDDIVKLSRAYELSRNESN
jgi:hypothetical protein